MDALRKQIGEISQHKDRAGLARLVVAQGFFWERENGDSADKRKSGIDNLATVLGLNNKDGAGWEILFSFTDDPTASASPDHKGAVCAPAEPTFDGQAFDALLKATQTDVSEWGYPVSAGIEVHALAQAAAPVIEKLGVNFVRVMPEGARDVAGLSARRHADRKDRLRVGRLDRADRQRPDLLRQGRRRLEDRRLYRRRRAAIAHGSVFSRGAASWR